MTRTQGRWSNGIYSLNNTVVGTVLESPNGYWYAHGCMDDWEDVNLGAHNSEEDAKKKVESWVEEHREDSSS